MPTISVFVPMRINTGNDYKRYHRNRISADPRDSGRLIRNRNVKDQIGELAAVY